MTTAHYRTVKSVRRSGVAATAFALTVTGCASTPTSPGPTNSANGSGTENVYTLTIENPNNLQRCSYATVKLHTREGNSQGERFEEVYSEAFDGGKVLLTGQHVGKDAQNTPLPQGEYEGRAYLSRPVSDYTVAVRDREGQDAVTVAIRVTKTAEGKRHIPFRYPVEPNIFIDGKAVPGGQVEVTALDEGHDPKEKSVTVSSDALQAPVQLAFNGKSYTGKATVRDDAPPGRYDLNLLSHFGCARATAGTMHITG